MIGGGLMRMDMVVELVGYLGVYSLIIPGAASALGRFWMLVSAGVLWVCVLLTLDGARVSHLHFQALAKQWKEGEITIKPSDSSGIWRRWRRYLQQQHDDQQQGGVNKEGATTGGGRDPPSLARRSAELEMQPKEMLRALLKVPLIDLVENEVIVFSDLKPFRGSGRIPPTKRKTSLMSSSPRRQSSPTSGAPLSSLSNVTPTNKMKPQQQQQLGGKSWGFGGEHGKEEIDKNSTKTNNYSTKVANNYIIMQKQKEEQRHSKMGLRRIASSAAFGADLGDLMKDRLRFSPEEDGNISDDSDDDALQSSVGEYYGNHSGGTPRSGSATSLSLTAPPVNTQNDKSADSLSFTLSSSRSPGMSPALSSSEFDLTCSGAGGFKDQQHHLPDQKIAGASCSSSSSLLPTPPTTLKEDDTRSLSQKKNEKRLSTAKIVETFEQRAAVVGESCTSSKRATFGGEEPANSPRSENEKSKKSTMLSSLCLRIATPPRPPVESGKEQQIATGSTPLSMKKREKKKKFSSSPRVELLPSSRALMYFYLGRVGGVCFSIMFLCSTMGTLMSRMREPSVVLFRYAKHNAYSSSPYLHDLLGGLVAVLTTMIDDFSPFSSGVARSGTTATATSSSSFSPAGSTALFFGSAVEVGAVILVALVIRLVLAVPDRFMRHVRTYRTFHLLGCHLFVFFLVLLDAVLCFSYNHHISSSKTNTAGRGGGAGEGSPPPLVSPFEEGVVRLEHIPHRKAVTAAAAGQLLPWEGVSMGEMKVPNFSSKNKKEAAGDDLDDDSTTSPTTTKPEEEEFLDLENTVYVLYMYLAVLMVPHAGTPVLFHTRGIPTGAKLNRRLATLASGYFALLGLISTYGGTGLSGVLPRGYFNELQITPVTMTSVEQWWSTGSDYQDAAMLSSWVQRSIFAKLGCYAVMSMSLLHTLANVGAYSVFLQELQRLGSTLSWHVVGGRRSSSSLSSSRSGHDTTAATLRFLFQPSANLTYLVCIVTTFLLRYGPVFEWCNMVLLVAYHLFFSVIALRVRRGSHSRSLLGFSEENNNNNLLLLHGGLERRPQETAALLNEEGFVGSPTTPQGRAGTDSRSTSPLPTLLRRNTSNLLQHAKEKAIATATAAARAKESGGLDQIHPGGKTGLVGSSDFVMAAVGFFWFYGVLYYLQVYLVAYF